MKKLFLIIAFSLFLPMAAKADELMIVNAPTASLSCSGSTSRVAYGALNSSNIIITNTGSVPAFVKSGGATVTAAVTDTIIAPGSVQSFLKTPSETYIACITAGTAATVYVQTGSGE